MDDKQQSLMKGIEAFVNRPRDPKVVERIKKFASAASSQWGVSEKPLISRSVGAESREAEWNPVLALFAPVGYRPLFEQELVFLMDRGVSYESVMQMPIPIRKKLIDWKIGKKQAGPETDEPFEIPPAFLKQLEAARAAKAGPGR
jgi:hypothetical protein